MSKSKKPLVCVVDEETLPNPTVLARFDTINQAEDYIESLITTDKEKVERGGYGIDAPEHMQ